MSRTSSNSRPEGTVGGLGVSWGSYRSPILPLLLDRGWDALDFQPRARDILVADLRVWAQSPPEVGRSLPNAYAFFGPSGCGQEEAFVLLASSVLCSRPVDWSGAPSPCRQCRNCRLVVGGSHPDAAILEPEGNTYLVEFIRERVVSESKYSGAGGGRRFVLLRESERLSPAASNALLRTVEEPLGRVTFVLVASPDRDAILPTLTSRCRGIAFFPIPPARLAELLIAAGYDPERVEAGIAASDGSLEGASQAAETGSYVEFTMRVAQLIRPVFYDASVNPYEVSGMLRESIDSVIDEARSILDSEIEEARDYDEELGLGTESGPAQVLRVSRQRRLRRLETALCRRVVTVCESLALACGLLSSGLAAEAARRLDHLGGEPAKDIEFLAAAPASGGYSAEYLDRIAALALKSRASLVLNPRTDLWLDGLITELSEIVTEA